MIAYIKGILAGKETDQILVEGGAVGYAIRVPSSLIGALPSVGSQVKIHTYLHVKEDLMQLYGFMNRDDLALFKLLIGVNGIGPKGALGILSGLTADSLRFAILSGDVKTISKAPSVGQKTAQKLILELKDKLDLADVFETASSHTEESKQMDSGAVNDAVLALSALGYSQSDALKAVSGIEKTSDMSVEEILKAALKRMS